MPHSAASDLGLRCLPMSVLWDTRYKWVKVNMVEKLNLLDRNDVHPWFWHLIFSVDNSTLAHLQFGKEHCVRVHRGYHLDTRLCHIGINTHHA